MKERRLAGALVGEGGWERVEVQEVGDVIETEAEVRVDVGIGLM